MISRSFFMAAGGLTLSIPKAFAQSDKYHFTLGVASGKTWRSGYRVVVNPHGSEATVSTDVTIDIRDV